MHVTTKTRFRGVKFGSCYTYSPFGGGTTSARSRLLCELLKANDDRFMFKYAVRVRQQVLMSSPLAGFLGPGDVLIPVPGCAPRSSRRRSVAEHLSTALVSEGLGLSVWPCLRRVCPVQKSATAIPGSRPTVGTHYHSFAVESVSATPVQVVLVDDVVTKGRTLLAAAACVQDAFPDAQIRAFALVRTMGLAPRVSRLLDPCVGEIKWRAGDAYRKP
jgi:hypothetical protein